MDFMESNFDRDKLIEAITTKMASMTTTQKMDLLSKILDINADIEPQIRNQPNIFISSRQFSISDLNELYNYCLNVK